MSKEMMIRIATKQMQAEFIKIAGLLKELDKQLPVEEVAKAA
jgi:septum formation inhibitor MinC